MARQERTVPHHRYTVTRRSRLEEAARERLKDAQALMEGDRHLGAQYLGGYVRFAHRRLRLTVIECLLKSIICLRYGEIRLEEAETALSRRRGRALSLRTHELEVLLDYADLKNSIQTFLLKRKV